MRSGPAPPAAGQATASFTVGTRRARRVRYEIVRGLDPREALRLALATGWRWTEEEVAHRIALEPEGAFSAVGPDGAVLGCATCVTWSGPSGGFAWIGSMLVREDARGQGIARALLRHAMAYAQGKGIATLGLDATPQARPLYESEGFVPVGETTVWERPPDAPRAPPGPSGRWAIYPVSSCEIMELHAYDAPAFGASRGRYLADLIARYPYRSFVAVDRRTGAFSGFALSEATRLGPVVADAPDAAAWLLHACERAGAPARAILGPEPQARALFEAAGYAPTGNACTRMVKGGPLPGLPGRVYAIGGRALG